MKKYLFFIISLILFTGCQSSSSGSNSNPLKPRVVISNLQSSNVSSIKGNIKIIETNTFYSSAEFSNISFADDNCQINSYHLDKNSLKNGEITSFEANLTCSQTPATIKVLFDEKATYIDMNVKTTQQHFVKVVELTTNSQNNSSNNSSTNSNNNTNSNSSNNTSTTSQNSLTKIKIADIQPSSITLNTGDSFTFYVYVFDENNNPLSTQVKISPPVDDNNSMVGEFENYLITTDSNGKGSFTYKAPNLIDGNEKNITVPIIIGNNLGNQVEKNITIDIKKNAQIVVLPTKLILVPNSITVAAGNSYTIQLFTLDNNNRGVSSTVILSHPIDENNNSWGTFDNYTIQTDENGEGSVTFTASKSLNKLDKNFSVLFTVQSTGIKQNLLLQKPNTIENNLTQYEILYTVPDSVEVDSDFSLNIKVVNKKTQELINDKNVSEINISSQNHKVYFDNNNSKFNFSIKNVNNIGIDAHSLTKSGIDILDVNISIKEGDNNRIISKQVPITIISGPVHTISINPVSHNYLADIGLFEVTYSVHAVDKYSNPVKAGTKLVLGAIVNPKVKGNGTGKLIPIEGSDTSEFNDSNENFNSVSLNDTLIIFPDNTHTDPLYLGGWIIQEKNSDDENHSLILSSAYSGDEVDNLYYLIGDERRYISCFDTLAVADFDAEDKTYEVGSDGTAIVKLRYDPYLVGHTVSLYANSYQTQRIGISLKDIFINNDVLTYEAGEDSSLNYDGIWMKYGEKNNSVSGSIYVGTSGGPKNTVLSDSTSTLAYNVPVNLKILTPNICHFSDDNSTEKNINTNCNGAAEFNVTYDDNGTCEVEFMGINYEY